ncbi:hypothetical protein ACOME3_007036 [Neoechinorhynchus agilis]
MQDRRFRQSQGYLLKGHTFYIYGALKNGKVKPKDLSNLIERYGRGTLRKRITARGSQDRVFVIHEDGDRSNGLRTICSSDARTPMPVSQLLNLIEKYEFSAE